MDLRGKTVLVTGASSGIGREAAVAFAREGAKVALTYRDGRAAGEEAAAECAALSEALAVRMDVTDPGSVESALTSVEERLGPVDVLVNNAGVLHRGPFAKLGAAEVREQVEVNLLGQLTVVARVLPGMLSRGEGIIVNVGSAMAGKVHPDASVYAATKAGLLQFTKALATELPPGVRVYCVNPGMTATRMTGGKGVDPALVAGLIVRTAGEEMGVVSGGEVDVWEHTG